MRSANPSTTHDNAGIAAWRFKLAAEIHSYEDARRVEHDLHMGTDTSNATTDRVRYFSAWEPTWETRYGYKIGPNMYVVDQGEFVAIVLYETEIIRYYPDGTFSVSNGGHATPTTTYRLGAVLPQHFSAYHHRKQLGLRANSLGVTFAPASGRKLWPLDHSMRIDAQTGEIKS